MIRAVNPIIALALLASTLALAQPVAQVSPKPTTARDTLDATIHVEMAACRTMPLGGLHVTVIEHQKLSWRDLPRLLTAPLMAR